MMENQKKICFFTHYSSMNGANQSLLTLIKYIKDEVDIRKIFVPNSHDEGRGLKDELEKIGMPVEVFRFQPFLYFSGLKSALGIPVKLLSNLPAWVRMYRQLKDEQIDCIYSNSSIENTGIVMSKLLGKKHFWHIREFGYRDYKYYHLGGDSFKRTIFERSTQLIAISESIAEYIDLPDKTALVHNGIFYKEELTAIEGARTLPTMVQLSMVGIIGPAKNQKRALRLLEGLVGNATIEVHLNFYGGVAEQGYLMELKEFVKEKKLQESVTFHGFVDNQNEIYKNTDVLLMCSPSEAFGRVTIEAMAHGIPVVGFDNALSLIHI